MTNKFYFLEKILLNFKLRKNNFQDNKRLNEDIKDLLNSVDKEELYPEVKSVESNEPETFISGKKVLLFCSLNYLGLAHHPNIKRAAIEAIKKYGVGAGGSRFVSGNFELHNILEKKIAQFKKEEDAVVFQTGYVTHIGVIPALMNLPKVFPFSFLNTKGVIFSDELNHASIVDGCKLSKAEIVIYKHKDMNDLEGKLKKYKNRKKLIITDSVFSMDGDIAPLPKIVELAKKYNAMTMIDEAHATGILGKRGAGATDYFHLEGQIDVVMGTLSKAIGCLGGYVAGKKYLMKYLRAATRPSVFSVFLPPAIAGAAIAAIDEIQKNPDLIKKLWNNADYLKNNLQKLGFNTLNTETPIIPILIGDEKKAIKMAKLLYEKNIYAPCIRWPAVPRGKARIRFIVMATHTKGQIDYVLQACREIGQFLKII